MEHSDYRFYREYIPADPVLGDPVGRCHGSRPEERREEKEICEDVCDRNTHSGRGHDPRVYREFQPKYHVVLPAVKKI